MKSEYFVPLLGLFFIWDDYAFNCEGGDWVIFMSYVLYSFISLLSSVLGIVLITYFLK